MKVDVQADSTKEMVLRNMPELLLTLFPVMLVDGQLGGDVAPLMARLEGEEKDQSIGDVSMHSDTHSNSRSFVESGKTYFKRMMGTQNLQLHTNYLELVRALSHIMDPWRDGSISSIALTSDGLKYWHKIPFEYLLTEREISLIQQNMFDELSPLFHNLSADTNLQKSSFRKGVIMLNSWELVCMILCKHI